MSCEFFAFGEILWDCLPSGRHAGGAPFNVTAQLAQLGASAGLISAIGDDPLGHEILQVARDKGVDTRFVTIAGDSLATGTVLVSVDEKGNATYQIVQPVAWDAIEVSAEAVTAVGQAQAFVFGSLACRAAHNREQLEQMLALKGPVKFFDVNLRPPFADPALVIELARKSDVIKLNDDELGRLASWLQTGEMTTATPRDQQSLLEACARIAETTGTERICVTRGPDGAALWSKGEIVCAPAPHVEVRDTVGAGDAFMAGLMVGLTRKREIHTVLEGACRLGAYVASHYGATPLLTPELHQYFEAAHLTA